MVLEAYSKILSVLAPAATIPLLLSPTLICKEFMKRGSADHVKSFIFISGLVRSAVFLQFGLASHLKALVQIHSFGLFLYVIYFTLYYNYCTNKRPVQNDFARAVAFVAVLLGYANFRPDSFIAIYFEHIATVVHLSLLGFPLLNLKHIIRAKSTAGLPFPTIFCANIVSVLWLLFGFSVNNNVIVSQMLVGTILTGVQLSLFVIYPSKPQKTPRTKKEKAASTKKED